MMLVSFRAKFIHSCCARMAKMQISRRRYFYSKNCSVCCSCFLPVNDVDEYGHLDVHDILHSIESYFKNNYIYYNVEEAEMVML